MLRGMQEELHHGWQSQVLWEGPSKLVHQVTINIQNEVHCFLNILQHLSKMSTQRWWRCHVSVASPLSRDILESSADQGGCHAPGLRRMQTTLLAPWKTFGWMETTHSTTRRAISRMSHEAILRRPSLINKDCFKCF